jgi:hypothetical protein
MDTGLIKVVQSLYSGNRSEVIHDGENSKWVTTDVGLKQGCPMSPLLFMLYVSELENILMDTGCGFKVDLRSNFWKTKEIIPNPWTPFCR